MMRLLKTVIAAGVVLSLCGFAQQGDVEKVKDKDAVAREVLVKYRAGAQSQHERIKLAADASEEEEVGNGNVYRIKSNTKKVADLLALLGQDPDIELAEPNYIVYASAVPNDTYFSLLWGLQNTGQTIGGQAGYSGSDIDAVKAWDTATGSASYAVGIVDTGITYSHPDLAGNVWSAPKSFSVVVGGSTINCAAGTHGFNAIKKTCDPLDDNDHGTHVAGTIGALANNGIGVAGINWKTAMIGLKFLSATGSGTTANAINAIEFANQLNSLGIANVRALNNSWGGGGFSQLLLDAINRANTNKMLFVAAAGNDSSDNDAVASYPASYNAPNVVSVAATDNRDVLASFSNYGATTVDLAAPGVYIASTVRTGYAYMSGTSMATPHVTGAAALILSACGTLDTAGLKSAILNNVDLVTGLAGKTLMGGRLNVYSAIKGCGGSSSPSFSLSASPSSLSVTAGSPGSSNVTVTAIGGFAGSVNLVATGMPAGVTAAFGTNPVDAGGTSTLTFSTGTSAAAGTYPITVTGTSGSLTATATVTLTISAPAAASFSLSASPSAVVVKRGSTATFTVTVTASGGFNSNVSLKVSGVPSGATATFNPTSVTGSGTSQLQIATTRNTTTGTSTLTITGTSSDGTTKTVTVSLKVR